MARSVVPRPPPAPPPSRPRGSLMPMKLLILTVAILLMAVVIVLGIAGLIWFADSSSPLPNGGRVALSIGAVAALAGLLVVWQGYRHRAH